MAQATMAEDMPSPTSQTAPPTGPAAHASPSAASSSSSTPQPSSPTATNKKAPANDAADSGTASGVSHPPGYGLRRARTTFNNADLQAPLRRRPTAQLHSLHSDNPSRDDSPATAAPRPPRRSSNFSEYSLSEARDLLNPNVEEHSGGAAHSETSSLAVLSLAFALLPALAGILFKDGSAVVTDVMLLGLAGVFLHWSVTQPWAWYHSAQEVRVQNEEVSEAVFEEDSEYDETSDAEAPAPLDDVPEDAEVQDKQPHPSPPPKQTLSAGERTAHQDAALHELYRYEILALFSCFILPLIGAYLLHAIRSQLSRPSEGLVSNYNLTIFLLVSEMRVLSHLIKLLKSRTLHLQRVVQGNASAMASKSRLQDVLDRLDRLESSPPQAEEGSAPQQKQQQSNTTDVDRAKREASLVRDVRNAIQPDLDALNRAVRRYEKKATVLQLQTESRFSFVDSRLEDAIALAAAAAKNSNSGQGLVAWTMGSAMAAVLFPLNALLAVLLLPFKTVLGLTNGKRKHQGTSGRSGRTGRGGGATVQGQGKWSSDRVPGRVGKR